ncbi:Putative zinc metalloprotease Rip2 [Acaryochloris thomasi RCC1774]|uniref:Zinc metalloprotease Rip2 n=1 Tax=Acaryochloris thomasi RCC1774 TaxID=1764569 RepID=A0A2W1JG26_9CYAN|nr:tetratricopeptide repeat protein [Acaryochloris thomasi]PZD72376.1 Putative zinc metalloprotease Rip2 [Acaryochloris thomasi RCC1774]
MALSSDSWRGLAIATFILLGWIISVCLHEFGHAVVAYWGGDQTVKDKGYLTLNPLKYSDFSYSLIYPLFFLMLGGIALPGAAVYINTWLLRSRLWQSAVSAAGPLATALVAVLLSHPFRLGLSSENWFWTALACLTSLQVVALCFNLLPVPSLDGFGILEPWLPRSWQPSLRQWRRYGFLALIVILWTVPVAQQVFWGFVGTISRELGVPPDLMATGYSLFHQSSRLLFVVVLVIVLIFRKLLSRPQSTDASDTQSLEAKLAAYDQAIASKKPTTADLWFGKGCILGELKRYQEAVESYDRALELQPKNPESCWLNRAIALYEIGRDEEAVESYEQALKLKTPSPDDWYFYGLMLSGLDRYEDAINSYKRALETKPEDAEIWYQQGQALYWLGQQDDAIASYDKAVYLQPEFAQAWFRRGLVFNQLQQFPRALKSFEQALKIQADSPAVLAAKGFTLMQLDQYEDAITAHEQSVEIDPNDAHAWYNKACCHAHQGQVSPAIESLKQAVQLNPEPTREIAIDDPDFEELHQEPAFRKLIY